MALREFKDSQGTAWTAWDVPPPRLYEPIRSGSDRRVRREPVFAPERREGSERRRRSPMAELERGWVCFQSEAEKRRLAPPPDGWDDYSEDELRDLCRRGVPLPQRGTR